MISDVELKAFYMKKQQKNNYFLMGFQFTSMILVPPLVCIFGGMYLQDKYGFSDKFMGFCVAAGVVMMLSSLYSFAKAAIKSPKNKNPESEGEPTAYELRKKGRH